MEEKEAEEEDSITQEEKGRRGEVGGGGGGGKGHLPQLYERSGGWLILRPSGSEFPDEDISAARGQKAKYFPLSFTFMPKTSARIPKPLKITLIKPIHPKIPQNKGNTVISSVFDTCVT